jgi:hypothetical protein
MRDAASGYSSGILLALSSENPKIEAACRAVRRTYEKTGSQSEEGRRAGMLEYLHARWRMLLIVFILLGAGVYAWRQFQARHAPVGKPAVAAIPEPAKGAGRVAVAGPDGAPLPAVEPGKPVLVTRIKHPGQKDEVYVRPSGDGKAQPDMPPPLGITAQQKNAMLRNIGGGMNNMTGMIRAGISPQKAAALTQRGLQESLNKQFQAQGGTAPQIQVLGEGKFLIHKTGPQPPAGPGGAKGGSSGGPSK